MLIPVLTEHITKKKHNIIENNIYNKEMIISLPFWDVIQHRLVVSDP